MNICSKTCLKDLTGSLQDRIILSKWNKFNVRIQYRCSTAATQQRAIKQRQLNQYRNCAGIKILQIHIHWKHISRVKINMETCCYFLGFDVSEDTYINYDQTTCAIQSVRKKNTKELISILSNPSQGINEHVKRVLRLSPHNHQYSSKTPDAATTLINVRYDNAPVCSSEILISYFIAIPKKVPYVVVPEGAQRSPLSRWGVPVTVFTLEPKIFMLRICFPHMISPTRALCKQQKM